MGKTVNVLRISRPSSHEAELHLYIPRQHDCPNVRRGEATGAVVFPVGHYGQGLPLDQPFEVVTTEPCDGCGKYLKLYFAWQGPRIFDMKSRDTAA